MMRSLEESEILRLKEILNKRQKIEPNATQLRAAIYARKSAEDERQTSLATQINQCQDFVSNYNILNVTHIFQEDGVSGMFTDNRDEYLKMMALAESGELDVIVVMKLDRLARDIGIASTTIKLLNQYGCYLIAGDDIADNTTPAGEFMRNILLAQNQYHARRTASDVISVQCNNALKGLTAGGVPPYGLKVVDKHFVIDENEAPAIRLMFERIARGDSYKQVIDELTQRGYLTRHGNKFCYASINALLHNDKYYGTYVFNSKDTPRKANRVLIEHFDEVRNADAIPPIISKELFDEVQGILTKRKFVRARQNENPEYILTDLIYCKTCGCSLSGESTICGRNKVRRRIYTHTKRQHESCTTKPINAEYIEYAVKDLIIRSINEYLASNPLADKVYDKLTRKLDDEISDIRKRIDSIELKIDNFMTKAADSATSAILAERYAAKSEEYIQVQADYEIQLETLNVQLKHTKSLKAKAATTTLLTMDDIFTDLTTDREVIRYFVKRIEIDEPNDDICIIFNDGAEL